MATRALDKNGDWTFGQSHSNYLTGNAEILQNIKTRLREIKEDCFWNRNAGIDYKTRFGEKNQEILFVNDVRNIILNTKGVWSIISLDYTVTDRILTLNFEVSTVYSKNGEEGTITSSEIL